MLAREAANEEVRRGHQRRRDVLTSWPLLRKENPRGPRCDEKLIGPGKPPHDEVDGRGFERACDLYVKPDRSERPSCVWRLALPYVQNPRDLHGHDFHRRESSERVQIDFNWLVPNGQRGEEELRARKVTFAFVQQVEVSAEKYFRARDDVRRGRHICHCAGSLPTIFSARGRLSSTVDPNDTAECAICAIRIASGQNEQRKAAHFSAEKASIRHVGRLVRAMSVSRCEFAATK